MKSIQNILQSDGIEFLDSMMNDYLVVYEKLNASTLSFRRLGNELKFYKGRDNEEITSLNETLYSYFKEGIEYLRRVSLIFYMEFPEGWLFRMQYFNPNAPGLVNYERQPKNNLVLSCIDTGNSIIEDTTVLKRWSDKLQIDLAEPVFSGFLSEFQKEKLMDYVNGNVECNDIPFSQYIISILNPGVSHSAYSDSFNTNIDSFIFKFYKAGSSKCIALKLVDPYMEQLIKQNKNKFGTNSGTENEIILANFVAWLQTIDLNKIDIEGDSSDERYMDLICKLFNQYMEKEQKLFKDLKSNISESYNVNIEKIKNKETAELLKKNPSIEKAFQVIVGSFMSKKNNENDPMSIMDNDLKTLFNDEVSSIKRLTDDTDDQVKSFAELMKSNADAENTKKEDDEKVLSFSELMDKLGHSEDKEEKHDADEQPKNEKELEKQEDETEKPKNNENESSEKKTETKEEKPSEEKYEKKEIENKKTEGSKNEQEKEHEESSENEKLDKSEQEKEDNSKESEEQEEGEKEDSKPKENKDSEPEEKEDKPEENKNNKPEEKEDKPEENKNFEPEEKEESHKAVDHEESKKTAPVSTSNDKPENKNNKPEKKKPEPKEKPESKENEDGSISL